MPPGPAQPGSAAIGALSREIGGAGDPRIVRVVAAIDAMACRGPADALLDPLRPRLAALRPPHPLRFVRLLFYPLDRTIVPAGRWRPGLATLPRAALLPIAKHVQRAMGAAGAAIERAIAGRTTADTGLIGQLGESLWPAAAAILQAGTVPETWESAKLGDTAWPPLARLAAALLGEAAGLDRLCQDAATGLLPPATEPVVQMLARAGAVDTVAMPAMAMLLLHRLPNAAGLLLAYDGKQAPAIRTAVNAAAERFLGQGGHLADAPIAGGTLTEAAAAAGRIAALLTHLELLGSAPERRDRVRAARRRLNASCKARFAAALRDELLAPLQNPEPPPVALLEASARGLRVLETAAREAGSGPDYDRLLAQAAGAIAQDAMRDGLSPMERVRLVEILTGSAAAMAMAAFPP